MPDKLELIVDDLYWITDKFSSNKLMMDKN